MSEPSRAQALEPWRQPWWYVDAGPGQKNIFYYLMAIHVLGTIGLALFPLPSRELLGPLLVAAVLGGFGTSVGYHRLLAHGSLRVSPVLEQVLIFLALFNGSGSPRQWVANHRRHHATTDTLDDVSSPRYHGFWWAHLRWMYQMPNSDPSRWNPDMGRRRYDAWNTLHVLPLGLSLLWGLAWGWQGFFWLGPLRLVYSTHMQCAVNSVAHMSRREGGRDASDNVWWLAPLHLGVGENWHRNHHEDPASPRLGRRWYELDLGWYLILCLKRLGLAEARRPPRAAA